MTNIAYLPQITGSFVLAANSDWRDEIKFTQSDGVTAIDLTGIDFHAQVRPSPGDVNVLLDLSTDNGLLVNGGTAGTLTWAVPANRPGTAPFYSVSALRLYPACVLDLVASAGGMQINLFAKAGPAAITVNPGVTV